MVECVAVCCSTSYSVLQCVLECVAVSGVLQCVAVCYSTLQYGGVSHSQSQYVAYFDFDYQVCCSVLKCVAVRCIVLQHFAVCVAACCSVLQRVAACYSVWYFSI